MRLLSQHCIAESHSHITTPVGSPHSSSEPEASEESTEASVPSLHEDHPSLLADCVSLSQSKVAISESEREYSGLELEENVPSVVAISPCEDCIFVNHSGRSL